MKVASKACAVIFLGLVVTALTSAEQESRAGTTAMRDFVLAGGVKSNLFATCSALANTVTGELFSIDLGGGKEYQRFAPKNLTAVNWVKLNNSGASTDIIACANAAFARNALVFKINGSCYAGVASGMILYGIQNDEQDCGDAPDEVVYVMTPLPGQWIGNTFLLYTESSSDGCFLSNSDSTGHVFNDYRKTPYDRGLMPQRLTCCNKIIAGHCVTTVKRPNSGSFAYCEAKTRCEALGLPLASYELQTTPDIQAYAQTDGQTWYWINTQRENGSYYRWLPDGQNNTFPVGVGANLQGRCAQLDAPEKDLWPVDCENLECNVALCIGVNTSLKQC